MKAALALCALILSTCEGYECNPASLFGHGQGGNGGNGGGTVEKSVLDVQFTTAFHAAEPFQVEAGTKDVIFGTFLFQNTSSRAIEVEGVTVTFLHDIGPIPTRKYSSIGPLVASVAIENCRLRQWPELVVSSGPSDLVNNKALLADPFTIVPTHSLALDVICDLKNVDASQILAAANVVVEDGTPVGFAADIVETQDVVSNADSVTLTGNGNPPKVAVIIK